MATPSAVHDSQVYALSDRLAAKGKFPADFVPIRDLEGRLVSDADLMDIDHRNGKIYLTRYEVKTGYNGRRSARGQAREWFKLYDGIGFIVPTFVYYNPTTHQCQRWKK